MASASGEPQEAEQDSRLPAVERFDRFTKARLKLSRIARGAGEWAGLPLAIEGEELVIDPSYRWANIVNRPPSDIDRSGADKNGRKIRNIMWSRRHRCYVIVFSEADGRVRCQPMIGTGATIEMELRTLGCSFAWGIEQESNALKLLGTLVGHIAFKQYLLTGSFLETSKRSNVSYMFRKLRPTVALKENPFTGKLEVLACLCMHPIGYYNHSWAGAMCPTDDVIAHLMLMRGDEPMYWRRCNQMPAGRPTSGISL